MENLLYILFTALLALLGGSLAHFVARHAVAGHTTTRWHRMRNMAILTGAMVGFMVAIGLLLIVR